MKITARYKVHVGGRRYRYCATLPDAVAFCSEVHRKTRIVLSIVAIPAKTTKRCELCGLTWNRCKGHGRLTDKVMP